MILTNLHKTLNAICPIDGVSVGDPEDKSTWRIDFAASATEQQKAAAFAAMNSFDVAAEKANMDVIAQIAAIEETITQRRLREAILGTDNGWLANTERRIAELRETLSA